MTIYLGTMVTDVLINTHNRLTRYMYIYTRLAHKGEEQQ